jgi:hypothetical protein
MRANKGVIETEFGISSNPGWLGWCAKEQQEVRHPTIPYAENR